MCPCCGAACVPAGLSTADGGAGPWQGLSCAGLPVWQYITQLHRRKLAGDSQLGSDLTGWQAGIAAYTCKSSAGSNTNCGTSTPAWHPCAGKSGGGGEAWQEEAAAAAGGGTRLFSGPSSAHCLGARQAYK